MISRKFAPKIILITVITLFVLYIVWETYWYYRVSLQFIKWHTHLFFIFLLYILSLGILKLFRASKKIVFTHFLCFLGLFFTEVILIITGINKTPTEKIYGFYSDGYIDSKQRYYWIDKPHSTKVLQTEEFYFERKMNSLGYSDYEWEEEKDSNEYRILCLGDSFTEGDGAHVDSSYVAHLRRLLVDRYPNRNISVLNAGKCGSDPFFNFKNYEDILYKYTPNLIIQTLSSSDLFSDIFMRGGMSRFGENYTLNMASTPQIRKFIFAISYTSRVLFKLFGFNENLIKSTSFFQHKDKYLKITFSLIKKFRNESLKNDNHFLLVILPEKKEVLDNYPPVFTELLEKIKKEHIDFIDLREYYQHYFGAQVNTEIDQYYWKQDAHHNAIGYELMANGIFEKLSKTLTFEKP